jgi:serine protease Do
LWDGDSILSSDAIRTFANNFFSDNKIVNRPSFGFTYRQLSVVYAKALQLSSGTLVTSVAPGGAAQLAGLQVGDSITSVNDIDISDDILLESLLENVKPAQRATMEVVRNGTNQTIVVTPGVLK